MDFTENSIAETSPKHTAHHQHFAHHRTSLPPTLSHLEAFLERSPGEGGFHLVGTREDGRSADGTDELKEDASQNTAKEGEDVDVSVDICLDDQSGRLDDQSGHLDDQSGCLDDQSGRLDDQSGCLDDQSGRLKSVERKELDLCCVEATVSITEDDGEFQIVQVAAPLATCEDLDGEDVFL